MAAEQVGTGKDWLSASAGSYYTCGIRTDGSLYCWGFNRSGELGDGTTVARNVPTRVGGGSWISVCTSNGYSGYYRTCAVRDDVCHIQDAREYWK